MQSQQKTVPYTYEHFMPFILQKCMLDRKQLQKQEQIIFFLTFIFFSSYKSKSLNIKNKDTENT
jgi:hypothetical protein